MRRKREKKVKRDKAPTKWEDMLGQEKGIVISDLGTSFHGIIASTGASLAPGRALAHARRSAEWPFWDSVAEQKQGRCWRQGK